MLQKNSLESLKYSNNMPVLVTEDKLEFYYNKSKLLLWLLCSSVFIAIGIWLIMNPDSYRYGQEAGYFTGILSTGFFGICAWVILRLMFLNQPILILNSEKFYRWQLWGQGNSLLWGEIKSITTYTLNQGFIRQNFLNIETISGQKIQQSPLALDLSAREINIKIKEFYQNLGYSHTIEFDD